MIFFQFWIFRENTLAFFGTFFDRSVETVFFFVSMRTFWGKRVLSEKKISSSSNIGWRSFLYLLRKSPWSYQNCLLRVHRKFLRRIIIEEISFSFPFRTLSEKLSASSHNFLDGFVKTAFYASTRTIWSKQVLPKKIIFSTSLDFGWQTFVYLLWKSLWRCQNYILRFHRNTVMKIILSEKYVFCLSFWAFEQSFSALCRKLSGSFFEAAFHVSKEILSWQIFLENKTFFSTLADIERKDVDFCQTCFSRVVETALYVSMGTFWGKRIFCWRILFILFWILGDKFSSICWGKSEELTEPTF